MLRLRADPWVPEYGMGFEAFDPEPPLGVDATVETADWTHPRVPEGAIPKRPVWFVDGVRRVELRVLAEDDARGAPGLIGSYAAGAVHCDGRARFAEHVVRRALVVGGGLATPPINVRTGAHDLHYEPVQEASTDPVRLLGRIQDLMRHEEALLGASVSAAGDALVFTDGPLTFADPLRPPIVGIVKRFQRSYLDGVEAQLITHLAPLERTPLFRLGGPRSGIQRYAWYTRVMTFVGPWHAYAGLVRCEVRASLELQRAVALADEVTTVIPSFAGRRSDPRTPQNLVPIAALEDWLRHRLGDQYLIRRALLLALAGEEVAA